MGQEAKRESFREIGGSNSGHEITSFPKPGEIIVL